MKKRRLALLTVAASLSVVGSSFAAMNAANTVNSAAIVDGQVMTADLANVAVTAAKIATGTITATQLAAGAVTDAKITGPISAGKIAVGNVIIVAKNGGQFTSPSAALASIGNASPTNRYLVKVMPGVYEMGTTSLQMQANVDLEGSGDSSVINSTVSNAGFDTCTDGTVNMANNSVIKNIKVTNTATSGVDTVIAAVAFNNVKAKAEGITAIAGMDNVASAERITGICSNGAAGHAILNNVTSEAHGLNGDANAVMAFYDGSLTISNSNMISYKAPATVGNSGYHVVDAVMGVTGVGVVTITNSYVEANIGQPNREGDLLYCNGYNSAISNSRFMSKGEGSISLYFNDGQSTGTKHSVINSQFNSDKSGVYTVLVSTGIASVVVANSLLQGGVDINVDGPGAKLFNNYTESLEAIPNL